MCVRKASELQSGTTTQAAECDGDEGLFVEGQHDVNAQRESPIIVHIHVNVQTLDTVTHSMYLGCLKIGKFKNRQICRHS